MRKGPKSSKEEVPARDVDELHKKIYWHPKFAHVSEEVVSRVFQALRFAERVHENDTRHDRSPYILHPIRLVETLLKKKYPEYPDPDMDIIVLILHDTIEDHPECWYDVMSHFGMEVFRDVLALSKISMETRREILEWIVGNANLDDKTIGEIIQILSPVDPLEKAQNFSNYSENPLGQDAQKIRAAILLYKYEIIHEKSDEDEAQDEYISLGNYLYFTERDARRKLQDMLDNMSDMTTMEQRKPGYIEKRRIKAYILGVKLLHLGMNHEYAELEEAFRGAGSSMYTDVEVVSKLQDIQTKEKYEEIIQRLRDIRQYKQQRKEAAIKKIRDMFKLGK